MLPGVCVVCGAARSDDRQYVDLDWDIEFYGVVYFCTFCFTQAANTLGCLTPEQSEALERENDQLREHILNFRVKEAALDDAIAKLRATGLLGISSSDDIINVATTSISDASGESSPDNPDEPSIEELIDQAVVAPSEQGPSSVSNTRKRKSDGLSI